LKDSLVLSKIAKNKNMAVPLYLMMAYAYYIQDDPFTSDGCFDTVAKIILDNWDNIEHRHKTFLSKSSLEAGTHLSGYPKIVEGAVDSFKKLGPLGI
jgi:hypothetical protein|tara:strand:+ start:1014 stop:1304 length:291 start_codon:yes stop_codon:yes gene_type:complete